MLVADSLPFEADTGPTAWQNALLAAALFAVDPVGLGGITIHAHAGPVRDQWQAYLDSLWPADTPRRLAPPNIADDRLIGGLDIAATLRAGHPVADRGLLAEADGGFVLLAMAERVPLSTAARITAAMDRGAVVLQRDGLAITMPTRFGVVALDESIGEDESPPSGLTDRLAFAVDLHGVSWGEASQDAGAPDADKIAAARARLAGVSVADEIIRRLSAVSLELGIPSARAPFFAVRAACAAAALDGRDEVKEADAVLASRLVLAHRAQQIPAPPQNEESQEPPPEPPEPPEGQGETEQKEAEAPSPEDILLAAAKAAIPDGLLDSLRAPNIRAGGAAGHAGALANAKERGRPIGVRAQAPRAGARLNVIETLRAAAPWQRLRQSTSSAPERRVIIRPEDFRVTRFKQRSETMTIFVVDASGSTALTRLAEAKGAVELLLADCYVRRDQVALIGFRGRAAELLLPPTRSLTRAKRSLAGLPGGGGTPLASGLSEGLKLAGSAKRKGQTPILVLLTDGRANVALDGSGGRQRAQDDAQSLARMIRAEGLLGIVIDTSPRAQKPAQQLADALGARYVPLPFANAASVSQAVRAVSA
nr:magnesium chelatase subunit D [Dichotomicrobium thermohalophilum]